MHITFIGLGNMGLPMANNLVRAGFTLTAYNRSPEKAEGLQSSAVKIFDDPAKAVKDSDVVITMLSDDNAVKEISGKILPVMKKGSIHLSMSTIAPSTATQLAEASKKLNIDYLAAPVMGRPPAAEARQLFILLSGKPEAKEKVQSVLNALGQKVFDYGDDPATANTVKLSMNYMIFVIVELLSEVLLVAEKNGIDKNMLLETMTSTIFGAPVFKIYGPMVAQEKDNPNGFKTKLASKDLRLMQEAAYEKGLDLPLAGVIQSHFSEIMEQHRGDQDVSLLISHLRQFMNRT
jgi:3-hydroxyisobutyrate dehydrogenase-like beta-hydroxyacid dehydrogenase